MEYISIKKASKTLDRNLILNSIDLSIDKGEICGIIGRNASGKSMLLKTITRLATYEGEIKINGIDLAESPEHIGSLIEYPGFLAQYTGFKNLRLLSSIRDKIKVEDICKTMLSLGLDPNDKKKYRKYSLGMRQRLGIACAIMEHPQILVLDEPTNNLDKESAKTVHEILYSLNQKYKTTILLSSHDEAEIKGLCHTVCYISNGTLTNRTILKG